MHRGVGHIELAVARTEGDRDGSRPIVVVEDLAAAEDGVEGGQALLAVDDEPVGRVARFRVGADLARAVDDAVLPEQQVADRKAPIHRVEQLTDLGVRPHERTLDVRQADIADVDVVQ